MSEEKQSISSEEVGSLEETLGENDPILRPISEPEPVEEESGQKHWAKGRNKK